MVAEVASFAKFILNSLDKPENAKAALSNAAEPKPVPYAPSLSISTSSPLDICSCAFLSIAPPEACKKGTSNEPANAPKAEPAGPAKDPANAPVLAPNTIAAMKGVCSAIAVGT